MTAPLRTNKTKVTRWVITYEIKDQCYQYWDGRGFSEVKADAKKYGTRGQAQQDFDDATGGQDSEYIHFRKVVL